MARYDPERMELSTRDRVALACYTEIKEGRGTPNGGVWLDVSHLPRETIMTRLPRVYQTMLELQMLDITTRSDRDRAHRALLDGRGLGAPRGPQHRRRRASTPSARRPAGCTAPTASAATRSSSCWSSGASSARPPPTYSASLDGADAVGGGGRTRPARRSTTCSRPTDPRTCARCSAPSATP